ncbi:MAG: cache domain-containing protein, partial [Alphaproteobacteria bacterium]|nr:cache domain-containing protein [Alphaproteobacteria bacterium]
AVAELKIDRTKALNEFNAGQNGFRDRDLYVFCFNGGDGKLTAHPTLLGQDVRTLIDKGGAHFGQEMYIQAKEGAISELSYLFPRPGSSEPTLKESYYTRVGDQVCGVGFYK